MSQPKAKRPFLLIPLSSLVLLIGVVLLAGSVQARPSGSQPALAATPNGFAHLDPQAGAPTNGGTVEPGITFTLDLKINAGSNAPPNGVTAAQSYLTFNSSVLGVILPNGSCSSIPNNSTLTADVTTFEAVLQNEVCNGPAGCMLRGVPIQPGHIGFASGPLSQYPDGTNGDFRVASITFCALAGGQAAIHWEFSPPAPLVRDSEILVKSGDFVHAKNLYHDYVINVRGPTATPAPPTWTPGTAPTPPPGTPCTMNFSDVPSSNPFYEYIRDLHCRPSNPPIITGFADGTFRPFDNTKRAQMAKLVVLAFGIQINTNGGPHFTDVAASEDPNNPYRYVETAYNNQIITGYNNRMFKPWDQVTRGQVAKMVVKAAGATRMPINTTGGPHFTDVPVSNDPNNFYQYIETAFNAGIITGYDDRTFRPYAYATRGQISQIVSQASH